MNWLTKFSECFTSKLCIIILLYFFRQRSGRKSKLELLNEENGLRYNEVDNYTKDKPEQEYVEMDTQKKPLDDLC